MTSPVANAARPSPGGTEPPRFAPREEWMTLLLVGVLALVVASSLDDARWILGRRDLTSFLPLAAVLGVGWGFVGAWVGWSRPRTYLLGAVLGALVVPILVGAVLAPGAGSIGGWYRATADSTIEAYLDLAIRNRALTQEYGHFMLALGLLVWGTGMFAAYATFGRRRPLNAVTATGLILLGNMSITTRDQLAFLVVFTVAALLVLVRVHAGEERATWIRRRLGDPSSLSELSLRGGTAFAGLAILGALVLTSAASSAPLAGLWIDTRQSLIDLTQGIQRFLPRGGPGSKITGVSFGPQATITGHWVTDTAVALRIHLSPGDRTPYYWRAVAYDRAEANGWSLSAAAAIDRDAGTPILTGTSEAPTAASARSAITFTVAPVGYRGSTIFSPDAPATVSVRTRLALVGDGLWFGELDGPGGGTPYTATALVREIGDGTPGGLTENRLRAASTTYPSLVRALYLPVPADAYGPDTLALLSTIRGLSPRAGPYDLAKTAEQYLRSSVFTYTADVTSLDCGDRGVVECFAHLRQGYCQHYASTMTVLLRLAGVPARFVQGFLPGQRDPRTGDEVVLNSNSHAWVEVFFPGYGWVPFDPTGGGITRLAPLPSGAPVPSAGVVARPSGRGALEDRPAPSTRPGGSPVPARPSSGGPGGLAFVVVGLLLAASMGLLSFAAYRRGPRGSLAPDAVFGNIVALAGRFGWSRRPTETVYEYAGSLAEALPGVRPELETVATAKVEVAYARRTLGAERLLQVGQAQRRVRVALLRLLLRRGRRRGERRGPG